MGRFDALTKLDEKPQQKQEPNKTAPSLPQQNDLASNSGNPENKNTRNQDYNKSSIPETQISSNQDIKNAGNQDFHTPSKREFYTKATYRLCDEALDAIGDAKKILKRRYRLKVNLEEIVETAVLEVFQDLEQNGEKSILVTTYSGNPENKNS
jgi:hypothetical protein